MTELSRTNVQNIQMNSIDLEAEQMTSYTMFNCKALEVTKSIPRSQVLRIIDGDDELKKQRTSPDVQFVEFLVEFSLTKQKTRPRMDYE